MDPSCTISRKECEAWGSHMVFMKLHSLLGFYTTYWWMVTIVSEEHGTFLFRAWKFNTVFHRLHEPRKMHHVVTWHLLSVVRSQLLSLPFSYPPISGTLLSMTLWSLLVTQFSFLIFLMYSHLSRNASQSRCPVVGKWIVSMFWLSSHAASQLLCMVWM